MLTLKCNIRTVGENLSSDEIVLWYIKVGFSSLFQKK